MLTHIIPAHARHDQFNRLQLWQVSPLSVDQILRKSQIDCLLLGSQDLDGFLFLIEVQLKGEVSREQVWYACALAQIAWPAGQLMVYIPSNKLSSVNLFSLLAILEIIFFAFDILTDVKDSESIVDNFHKTPCVSAEVQVLYRVISKIPV